MSIATGRVSGGRILAVRTERRRLMSVATSRVAAAESSSLGQNRLMGSQLALHKKLGFDQTELGIGQARSAASQ